MARNPYTEWLMSPGLAGQTQQRYGDIYKRYQDISEHGLLSPDEMNKMVFDYRQSMTPQLASQKAGLMSDISSRFGPGRSGGAAKSVANIVDVPANFAESEFASDLWRKNLESRSIGLEGQNNWINSMFGRMQGWSGTEAEYDIERKKIDAMMKMAEMQNSKSFVDYLDAVFPDSVSLFGGGG